MHPDFSRLFEQACFWSLFTVWFGAGSGSECYRVVL